MQALQAVDVSIIIRLRLKFADDLGVMCHRLAQQVTNSDNVDRGAIIDDRQVTDAVRVHEPQAVGKRMGEISFDDVSDDDVRYGCGLRGFPRSAPDRRTQSRSERTPTFTPRSMTTYNSYVFFFSHEAHCREVPYPRDRLSTELVTWRQGSASTIDRRRISSGRLSG